MVIEIYGTSLYGHSILNKCIVSFICVHNELEFGNVSWNEWKSVNKLTLSSIIVSDVQYILILYQCKHYIIQDENFATGCESLQAGNRTKNFWFTCPMLFQLTYMDTNRHNSPRQPFGNRIWSAK